MSEKDNGRVSLSRRKALAAIGASGAAVGLGGLGTYAQFTDTEKTTVTFTAGGVDGRVIAGASYNGETLQSLDESDFGPQEGGISLDVDLDDIKPGDFGCFSFGIEVENNPAWVASCIGYENSTDGTMFEPEVDADGDLNTSDFSPGDTGVSSPGEIPENMLVIPFYKGANHPSGQWNPCIFFDEENDEFLIENYEGSGAVGTPTAFWSNSEDGLTPQPLSDAVGFQSIDTINWDESFDPQPSEFTGGIPEVGEGCVFLNGELNTVDNQQEAAALQPGDTIYFGYDWHVPFDVGNEMQGDTLTLKLGFNFSQTRHTESAQLQNIYAPGQNLPDD